MTERNVGFGLGGCSVFIFLTKSAETEVHRDGHPHVSILLFNPHQIYNKYPQVLQEGIFRASADHCAPNTRIISGPADSIAAIRRYAIRCRCCII